MTNDEQKFHQLLNVLAEQCHYQLSVATVAMYDQSLSKYGYPSVNSALMHIFKTRRGNDRFPSVAEILEAMGIEVSDRALAVGCANDIFWSFVHWRDQFTNREDFEDHYRSKIGHLPWEVVTRMGGYRALFREWQDTKDPSMLRAQVRDAAMSVLELTRADQNQQTLSVTGSNHKQVAGNNGQKK